MNFVFFSPISWDNMDGAHRPIRFASELARRGHRVLFIELPKSITKRDSANVRILNLVELGLTEQCVLAAYYGFDYGSMAAAKSGLAGLLPRFEKRGEKNIAVFSAPFRPFLGFLPVLMERDYHIVFDLLDDFVAMHGTGYYCYDAESTLYLTRHSDLVLPLSERLLIKYRQLGAKKIALVRDGIDAEFWSNARDGNISLERGHITLGFWGWIWHHNVNVALLSFIAQARPNWQIHLIGPYDPPISEILNLPNIHFHGQVARELLPLYARNFDVCIFPAPNDDFNQARDPLKIFEYLACQKPVVATDQPQLAQMPEVALSANADEFVANIESAVRTHFDAERVRGFLAEQTWQKRVDSLLIEINDLPDKPAVRPEPPCGEMPNASNELDRWQAYSKHLERLIADRENHVAGLEKALVDSALVAKLGRAFGVAPDDN